MLEATPRYDYWFSQAGHTVPQPGNNCYYYSRSVMSRMPLGGGSPVVYREVTEWHGANAEFGKTRHVFLVGDRPPSWVIGINEWPFHRPTSHYWRWGQELAVEDYDADGRIQRRMSYQYSFPVTPETNRQFNGLSVQSWPFATQQAFTWAAFGVASAWKHPSAESRTIYDTLGVASISTTTTYTYGNPNHAQRTEKAETNSDGTQRITRWKYPGDYAVGTGNPEAAALTEMQGATHMVNAVVERSVSVRNGALERVMEAEITTYRQFLPGQFLPYQRFILNSPGPIP